MAIDLYRSRVVDAMRLYPTTSLEEERWVFGELCELFQTPSHSTQGLQFNPKHALAEWPSDSLGPLLIAPTPDSIIQAFSREFFTTS